MNLTDETWNPSSTSQPRLVNSLTLPSHDTGMTSECDPRFLPQPPPLFAEAQPWPMTATDYVGEEEEGEEAYNFRKVKMFEMPPSDDPELEERRQRALYAKQNRDMKKREVEKLQYEVAALRAAQEQCQADLTRAYAMARCQQQKTEELKQCLSNTRQQLREKDEEIRNMNKKMARVKEHLEVIAQGLDENNIMSRKMLRNLIAQTF